MIYINHEKRALFIHIPKTGGSYIGPTLVKYYGFKCYLDVLMKLRPDHNTICNTAIYKNNNFGIKLYDNSFFNKEIGLLSYVKSSPELNNLMGMNEEKWKNYRKFCFIRNPYSRVVSGLTHFNKLNNENIELVDYLYINDKKNNISCIEYGHVFMTQTEHIRDLDGKCGVNIIGRFEYLENDLVTILKYLGFTLINHPIIKVNVSNINGYEKLIMENRCVTKINELFFEDFENFHYQYASFSTNI